MPLSCGWNDMNAAFTSYEESAGPGSRGTGVGDGLLEQTGQAAVGQWLAAGLAGGAVLQGRVGE
jgi:hypothetical protein